MKKLIKSLLRESLNTQTVDCDCCKYFNFDNLKEIYAGFEHPAYFLINKREIQILEFIKPKQYIYNIARGFGVSYDDVLSSAYEDEKAVEYANLMKSGSKAPIGFYVDGKPSQEGRHRASAAIKLGCERIPIVKITKDLSNDFVYNFVLTHKDYSQEQLNELFMDKGYDGISGLDWREFKSYVDYRL
jgi:hypothetical protein